MSRQHHQFYGYNVIQEDQRRRLAATIVPLASYAPDNSALFNTFSLYESLNHHSALSPQGLSFRFYL
jgi:hypothetical protein